MVRPPVQFSLFYVISLFLVVSSKYFVDVWGETDSSRMERMVFKFSTCVPQKASGCVYNVGPEAVRTSWQDLLVKLSDDARVVTVVDDGRIDWDRLIAANNFNSRKINWYPSDFNGLSKAFGGAITRGLEWDAIQLNCKNSSWFFDISNVQRVTSPATFFRVLSSRERRTPSNVSKRAWPNLGCTSIYVLSLEAWEKLSTPGLDRVKGLHNIQCWARDLRNSRMPHGRGDGSGLLPKMVAGSVWNYMQDSHSAPLSNNQDTATEPPIQENNGSLKPNSTELTNITTKENDIEAKLPTRPSWVPSRQDSLKMEPITFQEATTVRTALHEPATTSPAYNFPEHIFKDVGLCFPVHFLETVLEEDEDKDLESAAAPPTARDERMLSPNASEDNQPFPLETSVTDMIVKYFYGPQKFEKSSPLRVKYSIISDVCFFVLLNHALRVALVLLAQACRIGYSNWLSGRQEPKIVGYILFIQKVLLESEESFLRHGTCFCLIEDL